MKRELLTVKEHSSAKYPPRTYHNATSAGTTIAMAVNLDTAGEKLTKNAAKERYIGFKLETDTDTLHIARELYKKMKADNSHTLNIAGNGIYTLIKQNCDQAFINDFVHHVVAQVHAHWPIEKIYTGGQTGVDIAGAVAGYALEIPTEVTLPNGFLQRFEDNQDVTGTQEKVINQIEQGALALKAYQIVRKVKP